MAVLRAGADGKAPSGAKVGDVVQTNGGDWVITGYNEDGSYQSRKVESGQQDYGGGYDELVNDKGNGSSSGGKAVTGQVGYITYAPNVTITDSRGRTRNTGPTGMTVKQGSDIYRDGNGRLYTPGKNGGWEEYQVPPLSSLTGEKQSSLLEAAQAWLNKRGGGTADPDYSTYDLNDYDAAYAQIAQEREAARNALVNAGRTSAINSDYLTAALGGEYGTGTQAAAEDYAKQILAEEQYRKAYYSNLARRFNEESYSSHYDTDQDYQSLINQAVANRNLGDAAIYETLRNQKIREQGLPMEQTYRYADWLSTGRTGNNNILVDSHGKLLGTLNYGGTTGTEGSPILDVPIIYSGLYGVNRTYGASLDEIVANLDAAGQTEAADYIRQSVAAGNTAQVQAILDKLSAYNSVGALDTAYAEYLQTGRYPDMTSSSYYSNFGPDTVRVDSAPANARAVIKGLQSQGAPVSAELYQSLLSAVNAGAAAGSGGGGGSGGGVRRGPSSGGGSVSGSGAGSLGDDFWNELISRTESGYADMGDSLREAINAQTQQAVNQYEGQKGDINEDNNDLYRQLYINRRQSERRLPQVLAAQGQSGGISESTALQLQNQYNTSLAQGERERIGQISQLDQAIANAQLSGTIAAAQSDAEIAQAALSAYTTLMQSMRGEQLTLAQMEQARQQWQAEFELAQQQWEMEYAMASAQYKDTVAAQARADLQAKADTLAAYGDFSGYLQLGYTQEQVQAMQRAYLGLLYDSAGGSGSNGGGGGDDGTRSVRVDTTYSDIDQLRQEAGQRGMGEGEFANFVYQAGLYPPETIKSWAESRGIDLSDRAVRTSKVGEPAARLATAGGYYR